MNKPLTRKPARSGLVYGVGAAVIAAIVAGAGYWWWTHQTPPPAALPEVAVAPPPTAPAPVASQPAPLAIQHPIDALADAASATEGDLPSLDQSDARAKAGLDELFGSKTVLSLLQLDGFARRFVVTVDNLARSHAAPRLWPVNPMAGRFTVESTGDSRVIDGDNAERYGSFVNAVTAVDTTRAVAFYLRLYPLFQQAYEELGYPGRYFNDRVVEVIDVLLATPVAAGPLKVQVTEVKGPIKSARPWVHYEYADPALEALAPGQKILLRVGPENAQRLKAKLADIRSKIAVR
jgi:hypothetical protein